MAKHRIVSVNADQAAAVIAGDPPPVAEKPSYKPQRAAAGPCPRVSTHVNTRIYSTKGRTRYCICDDCGETWKQDADPADALHEFAVRLAESFDAAPRVEDDGQQLIVFEDSALKEIATQLRRLAMA